MSGSRLRLLALPLCCLSSFIASAQDAKRTPVPVRVSSVEPNPVRWGEPVTVKGQGFNQGSVVILGSVAPAIVERTKDRVVFIAPHERDKGKYASVVFVATPGQRLLDTGISLSVLDPSTKVEAKPSPKIELLLKEEGKLAAKTPRRFEVDASDATRLDIHVTAGAEMEARLESSTAGAKKLFRATYGGKLEWRVGVAELRTLAGDAPLGKVTLVLATDSKKDVAYKATVEVLKKKPEEAAAPSSGP